MTEPRVEIHDRESAMDACVHMGFGLWLGVLIRIDPIPLWLIGYHQLSKSAKKLRESVTIDGRPALPRLGALYYVSALATIGFSCWVIWPMAFPALFYMLHIGILTLVASSGLTMLRLRLICREFGETKGARRWTELLWCFGVGGVGALFWLVYDLIHGPAANPAQRNAANPPPWLFICIALVVLWILVVVLRAAWSAPSRTCDAIRAAGESSDRALGAD